MYSKWFFERSLEVKQENLLYVPASARAAIRQFRGEFFPVDLMAAPFARGP